MRTRKGDFKKIALKIFHAIKVKYLNLSLSKQITLIGAMLGIVSLFLPWIILSDKQTMIWNAFHPITGNIGYILILGFFLQFFLILSNSYKENLKFYSGFDLKNHFLIIIFGIFAIILSIVALSFATGLDMVGQYISYGNGPIFCTISGILIAVGGSFMRLEDKKNNSEILLQEMTKNRAKNKEKENMELPF